MKISLNWLSEFIEFNKNVSIEELSWKLTEATAAIEKVHDVGKFLHNVVVGELKEIKKHPNADKLHVAKVKIGPSEEIQLIFGERAVVNVGDKVPTAVAPAELHGGKVEARKLRGELSQGMLCLMSELLPGAPDTLIKFPAGTKPGTSVAEVLHLNDRVLEIDNYSLNHRSDLFSHLGFARECVALGLAKWKKVPSSKPVKTGKKKLPLTPTFSQKGLSKNYFSTVISGVSPKESPQWLKARLELIGIRPINAIVDITNAVMMELGQPCHAFDPRPLIGKKFLHRLSKKGEEIVTLDGVKRSLPENAMVVESGTEIVDLPGIMGAANSMIQPDTKEIYLHVCHYDHLLIRRAMMNTGHRTDAGTIFEKKIEPERAKKGFERALQLFKQVFPEASFQHETFHHQEEKSKLSNIELSFAKLEKHSGISIPEKTVVRILEDLGFVVKKKKGGLVVTPPSWRVNGIAIAEDVIEEIVRIYGYSKVPANAPTVPLKAPTKNHQRSVKKLLQSILVGLGFHEEANFSFLSKSLLEKIGFDPWDHIIEIGNPCSDDFAYLRPSLLPYLLKNAGRNQVMEKRILKSFEMGAVFRKAEDSVYEEQMLTAVITQPEKKTSFYEMKGVVEKILHELGLSVRFEAGEHLMGYPGRVLRILAGETVLGHLFELHPKILAQFEITGSASAFECHLDRLYALDPKQVFYQDINRNPRALLDISVLVGKTVPMADVESWIHSVEPKYLTKCQLIDLYEGESLGADKKSLTFSLAYQHPERTLEDKEIQDILSRLIKKVESSGGVVRR